MFEDTIKTLYDLFDVNNKPNFTKDEIEILREKFSPLFL